MGQQEVVQIAEVANSVNLMITTVVSISTSEEDSATAIAIETNQDMVIIIKVAKDFQELPIKPKLPSRFATTAKLQ